MRDLPCPFPCPCSSLFWEASLRAESWPFGCVYFLENFSRIRLRSCRPIEGMQSYSDTCALPCPSLTGTCFSSPSMSASLISPACPSHPMPSNSILRRADVCPCDLDNININSHAGMPDRGRSRGPSLSREVSTNDISYHHCY
jgi:hypothetical protein